MSFFFDINNAMFIVVTNFIECVDKRHDCFDVFSFQLTKFAEYFCRQIENERVNSVIDFKFVI